MKNYMSVLKKYEYSIQKIDRDLSSYYDLYNNGTWQIKKYIDESWGNIETYVNALYYFRFILKYEFDEIEKIFDAKLGFRKKYENLGWYWNTTNYDECMQKKEAVIISINNILKDFSPENISDDSVFKNKDIITRAHTRSQKFKKYKVSNRKDMVKLLYYLYIQKEIPVSHIALYYGINLDTIGKDLREFNLSLTQTEARQRAVKNGRGNYEKARSTAKKTAAKNAITHLGSGSKIEDIFRLQIQESLWSFFPEKDHEIVCGIASSHIIPPKEVDIPLIIYQIKNSAIFRYAIEISGIKWHRNKAFESDADKINDIQSKEWKLIVVALNHKVNINETNKFHNYLNRTVNKICELIYDDIHGNAKWNIQYIK